MTTGTPHTTRPPRRRRTAGPLLGLLVSLASLAFFVLLLELALQIVVPLLFRPRFTRLDRELGWLHNPSVSHLEETEGHRYRLSYNERGFRGPDHLIPKPAGTRRVLVLGDSFVDAAEVDDGETFVALLARCLGDIELVNLGVYGYSTAQELLLLERFGLAYEPDLVLLLTISNDYVGNVMALESFGPAPRFLLDGEGLRLESTEHPQAQRAFLATNIPAPRWIHRNSLLYYVFNHYLYQPRIAERIEQVRNERAKVHEGDERSELYRRLIHAIQQSASRVGSDFVVTWGYLRPELIEQESSPNRAIRERLRREGIQTVDLFSALREAELAGPSLYYERDIHWNAAGNLRVAELLAPVIEGWSRGEAQPEEALARRRCADAAP